jgi:hypothetical protein
MQSIHRLGGVSIDSSEYIPGLQTICGWLAKPIFDMLFLWQMWCISLIMFDFEIWIFPKLESGCCTWNGFL